MEKKQQGKSKVTGIGPNEQPAGKVFAATIKVSVAGYVPGNLRLRQSITPFIFTANLEGNSIAELESDDKVISIAINERLRTID